MRDRLLAFALACGHSAVAMAPRPQHQIRTTPEIGAIPAASATNTGRPSCIDGGY